MIGIYKVTNLINNKVYIGQSDNIAHRWRIHRDHSLNNCGHDYNCIFYKAIRKYGLENFKFEVIEECSKDELNNRERYWIKHYKSYLGFKDCRGYNMTLGGQSTYSHYLSYTDVEEIQQLLLNTTLSQTEIGDKYGVSQVTISQINRGLIWVMEDLEYPLRSRTYMTGNVCAGKKACPICGKLIDARNDYCQTCYNQQRKINFIKALPVTRNELKEMIRTRTFTDIGKQFNLTDNAIRKWCDNLNLPRRRSEIKKYTDEEWADL